MADPAHAPKGSTLGRFGSGMVMVAFGFFILVFVALFAMSQITGDRMVIQVPTYSVAGDRQQTPPPPRTGSVKPSDLYKNF